MSNLSIFIAAAAPPFLFEAVCLLVAGALIAYFCSRLGLVPIVGFLVAGVAIGPNALGLVTNQDLVDQAAELGVMLLLFTIGIEFSLDRLARIKGLIFGGGGLQVLLATTLTAGGVMLAGGSWQAGIFSGFLVALSSTAIVIKLLGDRGETRAPHGRLGVAMLIFQDLGIIAMVLLLPSLAGAAGGAQDVIIALLSAAALIFAVLLVARRVMPPLLERVAMTCSPEVFLLTVIAICLGTAYLTSMAGVSVSLGAFLAGLVVSESRFSHHALTEILPLQILFSAVFFVSVGMLLDLSFLIANPVPILAVILGVLVIKILTTGIAALALRQPVSVALGSGLLLAQVGEFSFVLERAGRELGLAPFGLADGGSQIFVASTVGLMVLTPFLAQFGSRLALKETAPEPEEENVPEIDEEALEALRDHVIVAGYAASARRLSAALQEHGVPFVIVTLSPSGAAEAEALGMLVLRGDNGRVETLRHAGLERARMVVVADDQPAKAHVVASIVRQAAPKVKILVRTRSPIDAPGLTEAGADAVASDELESTLWLCGEVLSSYGHDEESLARHFSEVRKKAQGSDPGPAPPSSSQKTEAPQAPLNERQDIDLETPIELQAVAGCAHLEQTTAVLPSARGCEECLRLGDRWVHLRICMTCGHVGCCDSSPNRHATAHFHATSHPIVRSLEPGETWGWCYVDQEML